MIRAALYTRVSTDEQVGNHSLEAQLATLERYASAQGYEVVHAYTDPGHSGATAERPDLQRLLRAAEVRAFDGLLVYRLDRLARRVQLAYSLIEELGKHGVALKSFAEPMIDTTNPIGKAILGMMAVFAEWERDTFIERSQHGLRKAVEKGKYAGGIVAYGYSVEDGVLVEHPESADVVRLIFQLCVEHGLSTIRIAEHLTALGVPTHYRKDGRGVRGETTAVHWRHGGVLRILKNPAYKGEYLYGKRNARAGKKSAAPLTVGAAPALIDEATWERAQDQLSRNALMAMRNAKHTYMLKSLVKCGACGRTYIGTRSTNPKGGYTYRCGGRTLRSGMPDAERCTNPHVPGFALDADVRASLTRILLDPAAALAQREATRTDTVALELGQAERTLEHLSAARDRLLDLYLGGDALSKGQYLTRQAALDQQITDLQLRLAGLRDQAAQQATAEARARNLFSLSDRIRDRLDTLNDTEWQALAHELVESITVQPDGSVDVHYRV